MAEDSLTVYISIPMKEAEKSYLIEEALQKLGFKVNNPCRIPGIESADPALLASHFAGKCYEMMEDSGLMILLLDYFGRDCAVEIGYMNASKKPVYGVSIDREKAEAFLSGSSFQNDSSRTLNRLTKRFDSLDDLTVFLRETYLKRE